MSSNIFIETNNLISENKLEEAINGLIEFAQLRIERREYMDLFSIANNLKRQYKESTRLGLLNLTSFENSSEVRNNLTDRTQRLAYYMQDPNLFTDDENRKQKTTAEVLENIYLEEAKKEQERESRHRRLFRMFVTLFLIFIAGIALLLYFFFRPTDIRYMPDNCHVTIQGYADFLPDPDKYSPGKNTLRNRLQYKVIEVAKTRDNYLNPYEYYFKIKDDELGPGWVPNYPTHIKADLSCYKQK